MKNIRLFGLPVLLTGLMIVATGCTSSPKALDTEANFTGFITEIHPTGEEGTFGQILVEAQSDKFVDKYMVTIKDKTLIFEQGRKERSRVTFESLETKQKVQVWSTGPIMESFPMQGTAQQVVIIGIE